ncbi:MAG: hypothetical protein WCD18_03045, partial [Thermosynechococcaceae cyanobacterium]
HIPYVIGMNRAIRDEVARVFAVGFYDALGAGRDIEFAYKSGCVAIKIAGISEELTPVLVKNLAIYLQRNFVYPRANLELNSKDLKDYPPRERLQKILATPLKNKLLKNPRKIGYRNTKTLLVGFVFLGVASLAFLAIFFFSLFSNFPKLYTFSSSILTIIIYVCFTLLLYHLFENMLIIAYNNFKRGKEYTKIYEIEIIPGFIIEKLQNEFIEKTAQEYLVFILEDLKGNRYKIKQERSKDEFIQINDTGFAYLRYIERSTDFMIDDFIRINSDKEYESICDQLPE